MTALVAAKSILGAPPPWAAIIVADDESAHLLQRLGLPGVPVGDRALERLGPGARVLLVGAVDGVLPHLRRIGADTWHAMLPPGGGNTVAEVLGDADRATAYAGLSAVDLRDLFEVLVQDRATPDVLFDQPPAAIARRAGLRLLSLGELMDAPPRQWLVARLLGRGEFAVLVGPPASFKTFLALDAAVAIADGRDFLGLRTEPGSVVYVAGEGVGAFPQRIRAALGVARAQDPEDPIRQHLHVLPAIPDVSSRRGVDEFIELVAPHSPRLIVVDTWARFVAASGGDENHARDVGMLIAGIDRIREQVGCAVLALHHSGKAQGANERGSSALRGAADLMFDLKTTDRLGARLTTTKAKDAASPSWELGFAEAVVGDDEFGAVTSLHLANCVPASGEGRSSTSTRAETSRGAILAAIGQAGSLGLSFRDAQDACSREKATVSGALARLVHDGELEVVTEGARKRWRLRAGT